MKLEVRKYIGIGLLVIGVLILIENLNILQGNPGIIISAFVYGALSIYFFTQYFRYKSQWWLLLGVFLFGFASGKIVVLFPSIESYSSLFSILSLAIGFFLIYILDRQNWWALIPGSIIASLGVIQLLEITNNATSTNGIIFLGLGAAFLLMFLVPIKSGRMNWPLIPAVILLATGLVRSFEKSDSLAALLGPILLIAGGGLVLFFSFRKK